MTKNEEIFLKRMVPHMMAGKSLEEAAQAVVDDDQRLWLTAMAKDDQGEMIRDELCRQVYDGCRQ